MWRYLFSIIILCSSSTCIAGILYVDQKLVQDCSNYDVFSRSCGSGDARAMNSIDRALLTAAAGDDVLLRGDRYSQINVQVSGQPGNPVRIRSYAGETAVVSDPGKVALWVLDRMHVVIADLSVESPRGFGRIENSSGILVQNVKFKDSQASGTTGGLKIVRGKQF